MNFDNLPKGWQVKRLGEICEIVGGGTPKRDDPTFWGGNIVWVTPKELASDSLIEISNSENTITQKGLKYSSAKLLPIGTVIYSSRATIGKIAFAAVPLATNQGFANFTCNDKIYNRYLAFCLRWLTPEIQRLAGQTTFPEVKKSDLKHFQIPLPPLDEQHRIVARIEELTSHIEEAKGLRLPAQRETEAIMPAALNEVFSRGEKEEWEIETLGNLSIHVRYGLTAKASSDTKGVLLIRITDIDQDGNLRLDGLRYIQLDDRTYEKFSLDQDDILIARSGATAGKPYLHTLKEKAVFASYLVRFRLNIEKVFPLFLLYFLRSSLYWAQLDQWKIGGAQPNVNAGNLKKIKVPCPPLLEQHRIATYLDRLQSKVEDLQGLQEKTQKEIGAVTASILHRAFRGEL